MSPEEGVELLKNVKDQLKFDGFSDTEITIILKFVGYILSNIGNIPKEISWSKTFQKHCDEQQIS